MMGRGPGGRLSDGSKESPKLRKQLFKYGIVPELHIGAVDKYAEVTRFGGERLPAKRW